VNVNRILLVEDDSGAQLLYRNRLTDLGYHVVVSATGARGLMEARSAAFDLYLVDIDLGTGIDGYEVCRRLKTIPEIHGVPVVLISGHVKTQEDLHRGYEAGCQSFLVKGDLMLLEDVVRAMLRIKSLQDDLALQNRLLEERNRRFEAEKARTADLEHALAAGGRGGRQPSRPDAMLLCDGEGVVRASDRGARDLFGQSVDGRHLAQLAHDSRLEALVRDVRSEPHESVRFDVPERPGRPARALQASVFPFGPQPDPGQPTLRVVVLHDLARQRQASEGGRDEHGIARRDLAPLLEAAREVFRPSALVGESAAMQELRAQVAHAAQGEGTVLLQGPRGAGKALAARILHFSSARSGPFVALSCAGVSPAELEAELFGAAKGAEGGERSGAFQRASGGTLYLQDVEQLSLPLQERLLDALANGRVQRVGASAAERADVRLLAGTHASLARSVEQGQFLLGLERRLAAGRVVLPALAQHAEDIPLLARHFLARHARFEGADFSPEALAALAQHTWPEEVRGLEQAVQGAAASATGPEIALVDLPAPLADMRPVVTRSAARAEARQDAFSSLERELDQLRGSIDSTVSLLDAYEKGALMHALALTQGDKLAAARVLKIGKSTFYRKLKQHGIR
jgi:DNA-binding NtrC family response regulator